ncbi:hypothetical protein ACLB2K_032362 [Fragaria x ananassa]
MSSPDFSLFQTSPHKRSLLHRAPSLIADGFLFVGGAAMALSVVWALISFINPTSSTFDTIITYSTPQGPDFNYDPPEPTFYDDPTLSYSVGDAIQNWDEKRREWLRVHPSFGVGDRVVLVTGSQPSVCKNPVGDHLQLRLFKNKVDYCRLHGCEVFYNNILLDPKGTGFWAKYPILRAAMVAHPEAEWIYWVDSDAIFTDMEFKLPLEKYKEHNLVVHGWWHMMNGPAWGHRVRPKRSGEIQRSMLKDKLYPGSDDQSALIYLLLKQKQKWGDKVYLESEYNFQSYWLGVVDGLDNITKGYMGVDREMGKLRRRHGEKVSELYGEMREQYMKDKGMWRENVRRPFVTHFTGCEPCSGDYNPVYTWEDCWNGMQKALNFADNQVLRKYGFVHPDLLNSSLVTPLPFDYPA